MTDSYAESIWQEFLHKTGQSRLMSPIEWKTVKDWETAGYPLRVVLRALEDTKVNGRLLTYYAKSVEAEAARVRKALTA